MTVRRQLLAGVVLPTSLWLLSLLGHDAGSGVLTNDGLGKGWEKVGKRLEKVGKENSPHQLFSVFAEAAIFNLSISRGLGCRSRASTRKTGLAWVYTSANIVTRRFSLAGCHFHPILHRTSTSHFSTTLLPHWKFSLQPSRVTQNSQRCSTKQHYVVLALLRHNQHRLPSSRRALLWRS